MGVLYASSDYSRGKECPTNIVVITHRVIGQTNVALLMSLCAQCLRCAVIFGVINGMFIRQVGEINQPLLLKIAHQSSQGKTLKMQLLYVFPITLLVVFHFSNGGFIVLGHI